MEFIKAIYRNLLAIISPKGQLHFHNFTTGLTGDSNEQLKHMSQKRVHRKKKTPQRKNCNVFWKGLKDFKELSIDDKLEPGKQQMTLIVS